MSGPQPWGVLASGGGSLRAFGFEGQWGLIAWAPRNWGKQRLHSWRVHKMSHVHRDPGQKQWLHMNLGRTYLLVLKGLLWRQGPAVLSLSGVIKTGGGNIGECSSTWNLAEADILLGSLTPRPGPTQQPIVSSAGQKSRTRWFHMWILPDI